jgi:hypothetical protein
MALAGTAKAAREPATTILAPATDASRKMATRATPAVASRRAQRRPRRAVNVISCHRDTAERVLRATWETQRSTTRNPPRTAADRTITAGLPHHHCAEASVE